MTSDIKILCLDATKTKNQTKIVLTSNDGTKYCHDTIPNDYDILIISVSSIIGNSGMLVNKLCTDIETNNNYGTLVKVGCRICYLSKNPDNNIKTNGVQPYIYNWSFWDHKHVLYEWTKGLSGCLEFIHSFFKIEYDNIKNKSIIICFPSPHNERDDVAMSNLNLTHTFKKIFSSGTMYSMICVYTINKKGSFTKKAVETCKA